MNHQDSRKKKKLTRKRLNNAFAEVYKKHPEWFSQAPMRLSFFDHIQMGNIDDVKEFLEDPNFNVNVRDEDGNGCLHYAVSGNAGLRMFKLLVEHGADVNMMDNQGMVPLHLLSPIILNLSDEKLKILEYLLFQKDLLFLSDGDYISVLDFKNALEDLDIQISEKSDTLPYEELKRLLKFFKKLQLWAAYVDFLLWKYTRKVNIKDNLNPGDHFYVIDIRMTGAKFLEFVQKAIFKNPSMKLDAFVGNQLLQSNEPLLKYNINNNTVIKIQIKLVSGIQPRLGGTRKTRRRRL